MSGGTPGAVTVTHERVEPGVVERLLHGLPDWFGIDSAITGYEKDSRTFDTFAAHTDDGVVVGVLLLRRRFPESADVHLMAVRDDWHRRGVGTALLNAAEAWVLADGASVLSVRTLGPSDPDPYYARTRAFYAARGFLPVEELLDLWPDNPSLLMVNPLGRPLRR